MAKRSMATRLPMLRPLVTALLCLAAFTALTPNASAVYICGHQEDARDLILGDDPVVTAHCTTENMASLDCEARVTVNQDATVTRQSGCQSILCTTHCDPYVPLMSSAAAPPCSTVGSPVLDGGFGVTCTYGAASCSAGTATFGTVEDFLSPDAGCSVEAGLCELGPQVVDGDVDRLLLECQGFIQCVTEPCPGSGTIKI